MNRHRQNPLRQFGAPLLFCSQQIRSLVQNEWLQTHYHNRFWSYGYFFSNDLLVYKNIVFRHIIIYKCV